MALNQLPVPMRVPMYEMIVLQTGGAVSQKPGEAKEYSVALLLELRNGAGEVAVRHPVYLTLEAGRELVESVTEVVEHLEAVQRQGGTARN